MGFDDPQEDEFALVKLTLDSPLLEIIFPEKPGYFLNDSRISIPNNEKKEIWKKQMADFCAKDQAGFRQDRPAEKPGAFPPHPSYSVRSFPGQGSSISTAILTRWWLLHCISGKSWPGITS